MTPSRLFLRNTDNFSAADHRGFFDTTCESGISWFKWCPIDVALWVLLLCIIILVCWKLYITNRVGPNARGQRKTSNKDLQCRLELAQPEGILASSQQHYCTYGYKLDDGQGRASTMFADPHHDCSDNSPVSIDVPQVLHSTASPQPDPDVKSRGKFPNGVGLGINMEQDLSPPKYQPREAPEQHVFSAEVGKEDNEIATPDPAHVHSSHWGP